MYHHVASSHYKRASRTKSAHRKCVQRDNYSLPRRVPTHLATCAIGDRHAKGTARNGNQNDPDTTLNVTSKINALSVICCASRFVVVFCKLAVDEQLGPKLPPIPLKMNHQNTCKQCKCATVSQTRAVNTRIATQARTINAFIVTCRPCRAMPQDI